jgi:hypothetical protein
METQTLRIGPAWPARASAAPSESAQVSHRGRETVPLASAQQRSVLGRAVLDPAVLDPAVLGQAVLGRAVLGRAVLGRAVLGRAVLGRAVLGRAVLGRALLGRAVPAAGGAGGGRCRPRAGCFGAATHVPISSARPPPACFRRGRAA